MNLRPDPFLAVAYEDILDAVGIVLYRLVALQMKVTYCLIGALMNARSIQVTRPSSDSGTTAYRRGPGRNPVGACLARAANVSLDLSIGILDGAEFVCRLTRHEAQGGCEPTLRETVTSRGAGRVPSGQQPYRPLLLPLAAGLCR